MGVLIFIIFVIFLLWLYKYSEKNKQLRVQAVREDRQSDYTFMKKEFDESMELFNTSTDFKARLTNIDKAIEALKQMEGVMSGKEHASKNLPKLLSLKQALTYSDIKEQYEAAMNKAKESKLLLAKVKYATSAQAIIKEGLNLGVEEKTLSKEIEEANNFINSIQYDEYLTKAKKEEEKGNIKKAIDQYQVALYFLKTSDMEDKDNGSLITEIEEKIQQLYKGGIT